MSNQQLSTEWLSCAKERQAAGSLSIKNKFGKFVTLKWKKTDIQSPDLAAFKKEISAFASKILTPAEVEFLKAYPEAVSQELFLKPCSPLLEKDLDAVDWKLVEEKIQSTIRQFYLTDLSSFGAAVIKPLLNDVYFLVSAKDEEKLLGFAMFAITPSLPFGNVKIITVAIIPKEIDSGLDKLLMSSIFNILPETNRIFLFTRPTNKSALENYQSWGFTKDQTSTQDPNHKINMDYLISLEYKIEQSNVLQKTAKRLKDH